MDKIMKKALKADRFSQIIYELMSIDNIALPDSADGWIQLQTTGKLTIAGVEKIIEMNVIGYRMPDGRLWFRGSKSLLMKDFGVKPPKVMFGAIRTGNELVMHFDLIMASNMNI